MTSDPQFTTMEQKAEPIAKGMSLGQDAWRRLRRNRMAMFSLMTLVTIALLAFLTPLLPLAAPDKHHTDWTYEPPQWSPLVVDTFSLNRKAIDETPAKLAAVYEDLASAKKRYEETRSAASDTDSKDVRKAESEVHRMESEVNSVLYRPYREAGFPDIGPVSRWMIRMRDHIFGRLTLGSLAGRDEFGRDVLSRVF